MDNLIDMASFDDLDAPQYSNFEDYDQEEAEQYFEIDHESERIKSDGQEHVELPEPSIHEDFYSPLNIDVSNNILELRNRRIRRSSSTSHIEIPTHRLADLCLKEKKVSQKQPKNEGKFEFGALRKGNANSQSKLRFCSQENLSRLAAPKRIHSSTNNLSHSSSQEYVSVAEAVRKFHQKTPDRYHTNKQNSIPKHAVPMKLKATIPISPRLLTKKRVKMNENVLSHEERMQLEFEREQKLKIKAHPLNKKILQPMKAIHIEKKPPTVPEPFKLTEFEHRKIMSPKKEVYQFHAKPMPKSIVESVKLPRKKEVKVTNPVTPSFIRKMPPRQSSAKKEVEKPKVPLRSTKPMPFSFEKRDLRLVEKKEKLIEKVKEEEKKAREFHARPIPKPVATLISKQKQKSQHASSSSLNRSDGSKSEQEEYFKARPPTVLYQKPFEPKKLEQPLTEIQPFNFESEQRAKEREKFEQKKREQEELAARILKQEEEERQRRNEEEIRRIREDTKFKAHPIRNFKGVVIIPSAKVTEPISPVFLSGKSKRSNKENEKQY